MLKIGSRLECGAQRCCSKRRNRKQAPGSQNRVVGTRRRQMKQRAAIQNSSSNEISLGCHSLSETPNDHHAADEECDFQRWPDEDVQSRPRNFLHDGEVVQSSRPCYQSWRSSCAGRVRFRRTDKRKRGRPRREKNGQAKQKRQKAPRATKLGCAPAAQ